MALEALPVQDKSSSKRPMSRVPPNSDGVQFGFDARWALLKRATGQTGSNKGPPAHGPPRRRRGRRCRVPGRLKRRRAALVLGRRNV